ncbi:MAG: hypothetical protein ABL901_15065 [Hyphomicrobiaceae bacterium]
MDGADLSLGALGAPSSIQHVRDDGRRPAIQNRGRAGGGKPKTKPLGLIWSGLTGFVAGVVCWHFVGFWGFMTEAVFYARPEGAAKSLQRGAGASSKNQSRQPGAVANASAIASCSIAAMDRTGGDVHARGCEGHSYKFHPSRNIVKADRGDFGPVPVPTLISGEGVGVAVGGWSARIEATEGAGGKTTKAP